MPDRLFTTYQVADLLGATPAAVEQWIQKGWLAAKRLPGGVLRISEGGLVRFLQDRGIDLGDLFAKVVAREPQRARANQEGDSSSGRSTVALLEAVAAKVDDRSAGVSAISEGRSVQTPNADAETLPKPTPPWPAEDPDPQDQSEDEMEDESPRIDRPHGQSAADWTKPSLAEALGTGIPELDDLLSAPEYGPADRTDADDADREGEEKFRQFQRGAHTYTPADKTRAAGLAEEDTPDETGEETARPEDREDDHDRGCFVTEPQITDEERLQLAGVDPHAADAAETDAGFPAADDEPDDEAFVDQPVPAEPETHAPAPEPQGQAPEPAPETVSAPVEPAPGTEEPAVPAGELAGGETAPHLIKPKPEQLIEAMLAEAIADNASAVHLDPTKDGLTMRFRIDGQLDEPDLLPSRESASTILSDLLARAGLSEVRSVAEGSFHCGTNGERRRIRLVACRAENGPRIVLHLNAPGPAGPDSLNLSATQTSRLRNLLDQSAGLILLAAPTRELLCSAMQATVSAVRRDTRSVVHVDTRKPAELEHLLHVPVRRADGMDLSTATHALTEMDADVLALGEIRTPESAAAAVDAALDDRLVIAGIRGEDVFGSLRQLVDMGVHTWELASACRGVLLVRELPQLCEHCRKRLEPDAELMAALEARPEDLHFRAFDAEGCEQCNGTGRSGTVHVSTLLEAAEPVARAIRDGLNEWNLAGAMEAPGYRSLRVALIEAARVGRISLADAARA